MSEYIQSKKASRKTDWHPADIKAALEKAGWSLRRLALHHRHGASTITTALRRPYQRAERLIAAAIGRRPQDIWPSRYNDDGVHLSLLPETRSARAHKAWATKRARYGATGVQKKSNRAAAADNGKNPEPDKQ